MRGQILGDNLIAKYARVAVPVGEIGVRAAANRLTEGSAYIDEPNVSALQFLFDGMPQSGLREYQVKVDAWCFDAGT